ncbi:MAG: holo-[acyl-carrier-protein] synthase [Candidatus Aminicenantes bacterium]|nr:holo-[acyl-carrier-protein] synthase [Candidatus Aminicenantes bacterium]
MIFGVGTDIIEAQRIKRLLEKNTRFRDRVFTQKEIQYCEKKKNRVHSYAARFAAKEAFFKALGTGWRKGVRFKDVEVVNLPSGKPELVLHGKSKEMTEENQIKNIQVSLSHLGETALSVVILEIE